MQGKSYINSNGELITGKSPLLGHGLYGSAKCRRKCSEKVDDNTRSQIMAEYYNLSPMAQDSHLFGSLKCSMPKQVLTNTERHRLVAVQYTVAVNGLSVIVCKTAFKNLYGISASKVDHIVSQLRAGQATARVSRRGKHENRPNRLSVEAVDLVKEHIKLYPAEPRHYSRFQNPNRLYLSPLLTICEMYRHNKAWIADRGASPVSQSAYREIFSTQFNLGFGSPRSDTCSKCEATNIGSESGNVAEHKQLAESAFEHQRHDKLLAKSDPSVHFITFDLEKTLPLPKLAVSTAFYLRQLWVYNLGVHLICKNKSGPYFHVWTEDQGGRGVKEVGSALLSFFQNSQISGGTLIAWSDSCAGQNKNFSMICLWQYLVAKKLFKCIHHKFPEPGHSFLESDRDFGRIEVAVRRREKIFSLDEYCDIMTQSAGKPRPVLSRMADKFCDVQDSHKKLGLTKKDVNVYGEKIKMRDKVKWIKVTTFGSYEYRHSFDESENWKTVNLMKSGSALQSLNDISDISVLPTTYRPVNNAKLADIRQQLQFIPAIHQGYYKYVIACGTEHCENNQMNVQQSSVQGNDDSDDDQDTSQPQGSIVSNL